MVRLIAAEKVRAGLRHAIVCPNVTGRTEERIAQSKRACACWLARHSWLATSCANLYPPGVLISFVNVILPFSCVFVSFLPFCVH